MRSRKRMALAAACIVLLSLAGCAGSGKETEKASIEVSGTGYPLTVRDYLGIETVIESKPERVAVLSGTPMNIWYDLGGKSVCTADISDNLKLIPEYAQEIRALPAIGAVYSVNMEAIVAQSPDLIIAQVGTQNTQAAKLREMGYNVITTNIRSFSDVTDTYRAFGKLLQCEEEAQKKIDALVSQNQALADRQPESGKTVVILYLTAQSLSVKLDNSIAGDIASTLGLKNICAELPPDTIGSETTPLDIEYIVAKQPDFVLVTSMISDNETAVRTMEEKFASNPAWSGVEAVAQGRVVYLPQEYFLYNAGPYYNEAVEYMARSVYPEIYGQVEQWYAQRKSER